MSRFSDLINGKPESSVPAPSPTPKVVPEKPKVVDEKPKVVSLEPKVEKVESALESK
jgi:hypothetical protein